jgi:putative NIF3 family GTP cyclohydrolase 1 type 2
MELPVGIAIIAILVSGGMRLIWCHLPADRHSRGANLG